MTYEEFVKFVQSQCMHETIYEDSEGRSILVINLLDAYSMVNKAIKEEQERCAKLRDELHFYFFDKTASVSKAELVASVEQALDDYAKLIRTGDV
jgi:Ni2+-binding GTPase involved in maturation of urease and hydrogenase